MSINNRLHKNWTQSGFTLIELLVAIAITGVILPAVGASVYQLTRGTQSSNDLNTAINNVRAAGDWMSRDAETAESSLTLYPQDPPQPLWPLDLICYDYTRDNKYETIYSISGTDLIRTYQKNTDTPGQITVARNITSVTPQFDTTNNKNILTLTITATAGTRSFQGTYQIHPRL